MISAPTAREGQMDRLFLQKRPFIYILFVKKLKTGQKTAKTLQKKVAFLKALSHWLKIPEMRDPSNREFLKRGIPQIRNS